MFNYQLEFLYNDSFEIEFGNNDLGLKSIKKWIKDENRLDYWDDLVKVIEELKYKFKMHNTK